MAFFRQLKLLLWKNGLGVIRQPLWSITLITWPLIIFILIAVTRHHFAPVVKDTCYVGPRNLPSTGFFPFLQTLLCNTDSKCHNTSRLAHSEASKSSRERRSANLPKTSPLASLMQGKNFFSQAFPDDPKNDPAELVKLLENIVGSSTRAKYQNVHLMNALNTSFHDQEAINTIMESVNVFKKAICTVAFPLINQTSPNTISNAMVTFCNSNTTALEASLQTMNKIFEDLLLTSPEEMMTMGGEIVVLFDQLQNETSLWDTLLAFPEVFTSDSFDDMLNNTKTLLSNMQRLLRFFQTMSPDTADLLYQVHAVIDNTIDVIHYVQNWPGKGVSITLGDIVTLRNNSVSDIVKQILREVDIPLHQAVALMWDKDMVNSYLCDSSNNTIWLTAACSTGTVDMLLSWICPEKLAMEVFLAWTKHVAADDVSFVRDLVQSLMGVASSGKQDPHRSKRSMDAEPQSDEEELFLGVTQALLEITKIDPELDMVVHRALKTSFQSMKATRVALVTVQKVIGNVMEDTRNLQMIYHMLMTNQSAAAAWFSRVALSVVEVIQKAVEHEECEEVFESFEWLLPSETANMNVWRSMFCQNISALNTSLLMDWNPVVQKTEEVYLVLTGQSDFNLTLSMMLSEWNELYNASMQFGEFMDRLISQFGQEGWMNWFPNQYPHDITKTLQQSLFMSMANLGEELEKSDVWPEVKDYFHSIYWILNYRPGVEKEPPNCFVDAHSLMFQCDTGLQWPKFVKAITDAVMSPNENIIVNALKGTVNLLQHVYGDMYKNLTATYLKEEIEGGDALSAYLTKLILNLDGFLQKLTVLPDRNISDPAVIGPLIIELLESAGLKPLQPLLFNSSSVNASTVLDAVLQIIRLNQQIFTFGETDTSMKGLEQLIMQFLSMEGNLTLSFSNILGQSLLAYSASINPKNVSFITEVLHQFTNQTFDEAILDVVELLKTLSDSPNDLSNVLLGYLLQLRNVVTSLIRLQRIEYVLSSNGQLTAAQVTHLQTVSINFLNLLDPENPQGLTQVGPDVAQELIIQKLLAFLPPNVQKNATDFLQNFKALQDQFTKCEEGENCLQGISEIPTLLNQIIEVLLTASGDVTISISPNSTVPLHLEQKELTTLMFSLMLSPNDAAHVETFKQTLNFIKHIIEMENITTASVQNALMQSNLTRNDLFEIAALLGASSLDDFIAKIFNIYTEINKNCSGPQSNLTSNCFVSIVNGATSFLTNIPALRNETTLLSFIPVIVSETLSDFNQVDLSSDPDMAVVQTLEAILTNIKWILQMNQQNSSDIMNEITMVDHLIELVTDRKPFNSLNNTMRDPLYAQKLLLELVDWYIARVEMITSNSSVSEYLHDFFYFTKIQVATQLAQIEFTMYVNEKTLFLVNSLEYPLNGGDIRLIGKTTIDIIRHLLVFMNTTVQLQDNIPGSEQLEPIGAQIRLYLDLIEKWMEQPNIPELLTSMLQWGNSSMSTPVRDLNFLLQTMSHLLNHNQKEFLWIMTNLTESLNNALTVAEQPGGLQSDGFMSEILTALNTVMQIQGPIGGPLPSSVQQDILEIVNGSLTLIVNQNMSFASSLNISLLILEKTENIIQQTVLQNYSEYLLPIVKLVTTYFESISTSSGQDQWNQLILDEMKTIQSILPPNSTAQYYVHVLTKITEFILYPNHGNMSLWERFEGLSMETLPEAFGQFTKLVGMFVQLVTEGPPASSFDNLSHIVPVLEQVMTGNADQHTWVKLEQMLKTLLGAFEGQETWNNFSSVMPLLEKLTENVVKIMRANSEMLQSLQVPLVALMRDIVVSANSSHLNISELTMKMQLAVEGTLQAAQQANGTLNCSEALKAWQPVGEAAGVKLSTVVAWCDSSLQPVLEAYAASQAELSHLNMSHMSMEPISVSSAAGRMVKILQSLYHVSINHTHVIEQFIMTLSSELPQLTGLHLSYEGQNYWNKQLQDMQLQSSLAEFKELSDELLDVAPFLQPHVEAAFIAMSHILDNYHLNESSSSSHELIQEAAMIFLASANITLKDIYPMMSGNASGVDLALLADTMEEIIKQIMETRAFGHSPMIYQAMEHFLATNSSYLMIERVSEMFMWLVSTEASQLELLSQTLSKMYEIIRIPLSILTKVSVDMDMEVYEELFANIFAAFNHIVASGLLPPSSQYHHESGGHHLMNTRRKRDLSQMMKRDPMSDIIDMFYIDYPSMFRALSVAPTTAEVTETAHVFFSNPDLNVVMKGTTSGMPWGFNASREETIDATLGMFSFFTHPQVFETPSLDILKNAAEILPEGLPFASEIKSISRTLANESPENLRLMQEAVQTATELFYISPSDPRFTDQLSQLRSEVCVLEKTDSLALLLHSLSMKPGDLCHKVLPSLQVLADTNITSLSEILFQALVGDPRSYNLQSDWSTVLTEALGLNISGLSVLNVSSPVVTFGEMLRNKEAFIQAVHEHMNVDPEALLVLMETPLPNNTETLSWLVNLRYCHPSESVNTSEAAVLATFCTMTAKDWYKFSLLTAEHVNTEKLVYKAMFSEELQGLVGVMAQVAKVATEMMTKIAPAVRQLESYLLSVKDLNLESSSEFTEMGRGMRRSMSTKATFVTLSRALCSNGIIALFGISKLPELSETGPSFPDNQKKAEMIERFKIPKDASPFCMNMYLDMVNTTGGAIAWAFLKPMLMGQILFTPDTPATRDIMKKANATLHEFANLKKSSEDWIESSNYIIKSAELLSSTLPMLQNSLSNSFVKNFIEMQTDINVDSIKETLSSFSNITEMLHKNKEILDQISTLSNLMVKLSSCIKFDRYRGFDSAEELNTVAQELAKNRELYASVIFKTEDATSSQLPPKVSYTIRMHMDNVMRTDRVRNPYFVRDNHISATHTMRYNRGFVYLQENIDRAIIETQAGQKVTEPAVQLQSFPYPCYLRDEYLEAISFVFPLLLMIPWVLFVADFVKKLVQERELRLHEYMKMMGVNPVSHFFAWFLECASFLLVTIIILTLVLKCGNILPKSDGFLIFLYICDFGLSILSFCYLISSFFDKTYIAGLSGSLIYILSFFPFIVVMSMETNLNFSQKSALSLFSPTCFSYASQYISRYEAQGEGIQWSNSYSSPIAGDTATFGWLCWLLLIDSILYFLIGAYIRMVFPGKYGIPAPWYFPFQLSFWTNLCSSLQTNTNTGKGLLFSNIMQDNQPVFADGKGKGKNSLSYQSGEDFSDLPVGVSLHGLTKLYDDQAAIQNLNVNFHEGHVTSLLGHNGAGKTTTMSLLTGLYPPTSGSIEVYGKDMQRNMEKVRRELGVCMQYDVLFDYMTVKEHLLLYGQIKAPHWSQRELREQVRTILGESDMYAHRHKRADTLSGGMRRKLSISIAFIGGSRLVVLDEPTTGVDPCSRRSIWDIIIQHKKNRTIIMSTHHLDEAEVVSDRIAFLERGGLKCCGSPFYLKDKLGQGYKLTLTKKIQSPEAERVDGADLKAFIQAHLPEARLKETQRGDVVYSLPPFTSSNASSYRSLLTALDANLDDLQLGGYGVSDTTLEEVFLQLTNGGPEGEYQPLSISETVSDTSSIDSIPSDSNDSSCNLGDKIKLTSSSTLSGMALAWQQLTAMLIKRFHHSRRDWKGLIAQILLPVLFVTVAMALGSIKSDLQHYPEMELSPALYNIGPSYSFFSNQNPRSSHLVDTMMSFPGIDNACLDNSDNQVCTRSTNNWSSRGNISKPFSVCKCNQQEQICNKNSQPPYKKAPSSQIVYNLTGFNVENYLVATANDFIRNRYGGFTFGMPLPPDLRMDLKTVPNNRTLSKVWFNPEGHHTMPAYLNSLNNLILRSNIPADKDPQKYAISVSSHPYFGRMDDEDTIVEGMLQILVAMCILTGFSITTASFAIYEVSEHRSGSKRLQHIAGISEPFYWAVNFFYDMVIYLIPVTLTICVIAAFQIPAFTDRQNLGAISLLLVLFGFATFPWMYLLAGLFKDVEKAFIAYVCINLFLSINTIICTSILYFLGQISSQNSEVIHEILKKLNHAFLIFPQFNFGNGLMELARTNIEVQILNGYGIDAYKNPFSTESLGWMFISSFIQGVFFFTLRLLLNRRFVRKVRHLILGRKTLPQDALEEDDEDVATEHLRVASGAASSDLLQINQLTKIYQHLNKKVPAVKSLSVGIPAGECFGLLGVNGAGKTTTFKMLTGDVSPTDGSAQIRDSEGRLVDIMECRDKGINIGYCPQVDALDELLTGEEHLYFYSRIHGISKREIAGVVNYLLKRLELNYHRNIITDQYSCGTRRKLSTALALIGHPQILLLDEPSSGMDPRTKRHLWKIITEEVRGKCAVVLTSHSMEECEALCSRLAIMVKGQFRCLGSLQHIKNRFGSGFTVKMYLAEPSCDSEEITAFMQRRFPTTYLKDQHSAMVEYHVPNAPGGVADIFSQLESNKHALRIKHFAVSQTTLDEVFINFAMGNIGMETIPIHNEDHFEDLDSIKAVKT
ncbi:PREDICTED: ATP-binding cassette sub-family A member 12 [Cyprinodon variegatus]|uniref:ATP-binding cassette sub-family A member 12 n=1 Tax=Cyprinodon variegatus TaxID=28743 RepID=UPI0007429357|nr:PREDICTED: ATP-binding cassette sub-family A member 12 [Cyprinodon variegatus]